MIKHDISPVSLSSQAPPTSYFMTRSIVPQSQAHPPHAVAATPYHSPAISVLLLVAALTVLATELVERFGRRAPGKVEAAVRNEGAAILRFPYARSRNRRGKLSATYMD